MNPLSPIEICNAALIFVGSGLSIDSFEDEDAASRACRLQFPQSRREFLDSDYDFSFATTRATLAKIANTDNWYQLPANMIKPICLAGDDRTNFHIERGLLYTTQGAPELIFIEDSADLSWYPAKAVSAVQFILASKLAIILKQDWELARSLQTQAQNLISEVAKSDIGNLELPEFVPYESGLFGER